MGDCVGREIGGRERGRGDKRAAVEEKPAGARLGKR